MRWPWEDDFLNAQCAIEMQNLRESLINAEWGSELFSSLLYGQKRLNFYLFIIMQHKVGLFSGFFNIFIDSESWPCNFGVNHDYQNRYT